jgi:SAM-dependent methyltransferase
MKIHFGAFNCPVEGWTNTDITPHLYIARVPRLAWVLHKVGKMPLDRYRDHQRGSFSQLRYLNVCKRWPFHDNSADAIFSSHVVEHLTLRGARNCLANAYRVLKSGGVLRIVVPDLDAYIAEYSKQNAYDWAISLFEADQVAEKNMHHFMYNCESMAKIMNEAGFSDIRRLSYRVGSCPDLDRLDNRPDSLFMEAIK